MPIQLVPKAHPLGSNNDGSISCEIRLLIGLGLDSKVENTQRQENPSGWVGSKPKSIMPQNALWMELEDYDC